MVVWKKLKVGIFDVNGKILLAMIIYLTNQIVVYNCWISNEKYL
jgi:hypothetical protein